MEWDYSYQLFLKGIIWREYNTDHGPQKRTIDDGPLTIEQSIPETDNS